MCSSIGLFWHSWNIAVHELVLVLLNAENKLSDKALITVITFNSFMPIHTAEIATFLTDRRPLRVWMISLMVISLGSLEYWSCRGDRAGSREASAPLTFNSFVGVVYWRHMECIILKWNEAEATDYTNGMGIMFQEAEGHFRFDHHNEWG